MVYKQSDNPRNSPGRYNTTGQFVPAQQQYQPLPQSQLQQQSKPQQQYQPTPQSQLQQRQQQQYQVPKPQHLHIVKIDARNLDMQTNSQLLTSGQISQPNSEMAGESLEADESGVVRPPWMKSKIPGLKKISKKEKRRRQNEHLRRLITPKNALMVLNEMMQHDQNTNFRVEPAEGSIQVYNKAQRPSFCADLTLDGIAYKGYGENKLAARNAAAEQAIRDLILKRMQKAATIDIGEGGPQVNTEEEPLPMMQLASFALHKLFSEWEYEGHKVPQLRPPREAMELELAGRSAGAEQEAGLEGAEGASVKSPRPPKAVPSNAHALHPCMLLAYLRPQLQYRPLAALGDRPQDMLYTLAVDVDGHTFVGKASNKKEARKAAAKAACNAIFGVQFDPQPTATVPTH